MEIDPDMVPWHDDLVTVKPDIKDGHLCLPDRPRLGHRGQRGGRARAPAPRGALGPPAQIPVPNPPAVRTVVASPM